ncbi:unnamed protein product [Cunninghamella blakesleeana]
MIHLYGISNLNTRELFDIDELNTVEDEVYGVIFSSALNESLPPIEANDPEIESMFFSCQVVTNVCATSALLGILLNIQDKEIKIGNELLEFKEFTKDFNSVDRGLAISNSEFLKDIHNGFGTLESNQSTHDYPQYNDIYASKKRKKCHLQSNTDYHYTSFIPFDGGIWELDGYNKSPVKCGSKDGNNWLSTVYNVIKSRMEATDALEFNIILITKSQQQQPPPNTSAVSTENKFYEKLLSKSINYLKTQYGGDGDKQVDSLQNIYFDIIEKSKTLKEEEYDDYITKLFPRMESASQKDGILMLQKIANSGLEKKEIQPKKAPDDLSTFIDRSRHNYIPFINTLFKKLDEQNLLQNIK